MDKKRREYPYDTIITSRPQGMSYDEYKILRKDQYYKLKGYLNG